MCHPIVGISSIKPFDIPQTFITNNKIFWEEWINSLRLRRFWQLLFIAEQNNFKPYYLVELLSSAKTLDVVEHSSTINLRNTLSKYESEKKTYSTLIPTHGIIQFVLEHWWVAHSKFWMWNLYLYWQVLKKNEQTENWWLRWNEFNYQNEFKGITIRNECIYKKINLHGISQSWSSKIGNSDYELCKNAILFS